MAASLSKGGKEVNCPTCNVQLSMTERQGVEIDYCPQCRGVWLDRGELDKIIEKSSSGRSFEDRDDEDREERDRPEGSRKGKRGGFWGNLLDFGGD